MNDPYWEANKDRPIAALGRSPRYMLQTLGTDWARGMVNDDIWITLASQAALRNGVGMVISDVRFDNEAKWVRDVGGVIIEVRRNSVTPVEEHSSENPVTLIDSDFIVNNNGSLEELQDKVRELFHGS